MSISSALIPHDPLDVYFAGAECPTQSSAQFSSVHLMRAAVDAIDKDYPNLPVTQAMRLTDLLSNSLSLRRLSAFCSGCSRFLRSYSPQPESMAS